jgi:hypothetical protein
MRRLRLIFLTAIAVVFLCALLHFGARIGWAQSASGTLSQEEIADLGEAAPIVEQLRPLQNKAIVFIFDVSGSMNSEGMLKRARQVTARIARYAVRPGDDILLLTFGAGYESFVRKINDGDDRQKVLERIPVTVGQDSGTNIRRPHHEALKFLEKVTAGNNRPAAIIVLTDSYNDEPKRTNSAFEDYTRYYTPGGKLLKYPPTSENRDYERLLSELVESGRVRQYGVGVTFAPNGRPVERLPQSAPPPVEAPSQPPSPQNTSLPKPAPPSFPYWWALLGAGVLISGTLAVIPFTKTQALRITGVPGGQRDFVVGSGKTIRIGGEGTSQSPDAYGIPGVHETIAIIKGSRGIMSISPALRPKSGGDLSSNQNAAVRVYVSGLPLESELPLNFGDELRISVSTPEGISREYRLKFDDPRKGY